MESLCRLQFHHLPLRLSLNRHRLSIPRPISSLSFRTSPLYPPSSLSLPPSPSSKSKSVRASPSSSSDPLPENSELSPSGEDPLPENSELSPSGEVPLPDNSEISPSGEDPLPTNPSSSSPSTGVYPRLQDLRLPLTAEEEEEILRREGKKRMPRWLEFLIMLNPIVLEMGVAAIVSLFFFRGNLTHFLYGLAPPRKVDHSTRDYANMSRAEFADKFDLDTFSDVAALKSFLELSVEENNDEVAVLVLQRLMELQPDVDRWPILKAKLLRDNGETQLAKKVYEEMIEKDPLSIRAFHGLRALLEDDSGDGLDDLSKRVKSAMEVLQEDPNRRGDLREFKQLLGQIEFMRFHFDDALKVFQELEEEDPNDYLPYYVQGIIHATLGMKEEAEQQFKKFRQVVPEYNNFAKFDEKKLIRDLSKRSPKSKNKQKRLAKAKEEGKLAGESRTNENEGMIASENKKE